MPITGHFEADFSQFNEGVKDATGTLQQFAKDSTTAGKEIDKLGAGAPAAIKPITQETKAAGASMADMGNMARQAGGMIAGAFTVNAILSFASSVLDAADNIGKLATQTGMTTKEVQQLQYISTQTSVSMGSLTGAAQQLAADLGDNNRGVVGALVDLNISVSDFKKLDPYQQMITLSRAVQGIEDPYKRAAAAEAIFHKNWKELYPAMMTDMKALGDRASTMSDGVLLGLQQTKSRIDELKNDAMTMGGFLVFAVAKTWDLFSGYEAVRLGNAATAKIQADANAEQKKAYDELLASLPKVASAQLPIIKGLEDIKLTAAEAKVQEDSWTAAITERIAKEKAEQDFLQAMQAYWGDVAKLQEEALGIPALDRAAKWADVMDGLSGDVSILSSKLRDDLSTSMREALEVMARNGTLTRDQSSAYTALMLKIDAYNESLKKQTTEVLPAASGAVTDYTQKLYDQARAADAARNASAGLTGQTGGSTATEAYNAGGGQGEVLTTSGNGAGSSYYLPPRRAAGGPVAGGTSYLVGEKGPELFTPGASGAISPNGAGVAVYNTFHLVDTESNLARRVSEQIMRSVTQARRV
jgi:hypothetical protein